MYTCMHITVHGCIIASCTDALHMYTASSSQCTMRKRYLNMIGKLYFPHTFMIILTCKPCALPASISSPPTPVPFRDSPHGLIQGWEGGGGGTPPHTKKLLAVMLIKWVVRAPKFLFSPTFTSVPLQGHRKPGASI